MHKKQIPDQHHKRLKHIATFLKAHRYYGQGLTQKELCENTNLHRNTIVRAENAKNLTLLSVFELADALDISLKDLFLDID